MVESSHANGNVTNSNNRQRRQLSLRHDFIIEALKWQHAELGEAVDFVQGIFRYDRGNREQFLKGMGMGVQDEFCQRIVDEFKKNLDKLAGTPLF